MCYVHMVHSSTLAQKLILHILQEYVFLYLTEEVTKKNIFRKFPRTAASSGCPCDAARLSLQRRDLTVG